MVQFQIYHGKQAGTVAVARRFPFRIGRSPSAHLCLDDPGIWDEHLEIRLLPDRSIQAIVPPPALGSINHQPLTEAILHNGDLVELGSVQLRFGLAPTRQRSLRPREILTWFLLGCLCLGQVTLIYFLV